MLGFFFDCFWMGVGSLLGSIFDICLYRCISITSMTFFLFFHCCGEGCWYHFRGSFDKFHVRALTLRNLDLGRQCYGFARFHSSEKPGFPLCSLSFSVPVWAVIFDECRHRFWFYKGNIVALCSMLVRWQVKKSCCYTLFEKWAAPENLILWGSNFDMCKDEFSHYG